MIRVAAVGDVHYGKDSAGKIKNQISGLERMADIFLLAGDLTNFGTPEEAKALAHDLEDIGIPVVAVFGNHDYHNDQQDEIKHILGQVGVQVLENEGTTFNLHGCRLGIYGSKGFGGGFLGACGSDFGEPEMKSFITHTKKISGQIKRGIMDLEADYKIALLHYAPTAETLLGERKEIYPFLGSYLLGEAIDEAGAQLIFHGHAHRGVEKGSTTGGIPVRNVAQPVIRHAFNVYTLGTDEYQYRTTNKEDSRAQA